MARKKKKRRVHQKYLVIMTVEEFAGKSDAPCNERLANFETAELHAASGGRYSYAMFADKPVRGPSLYEREALKMRARALKRIA